MTNIQIPDIDTFLDDHVTHRLSIGEDIKTACRQAIEELKEAYKTHEWVIHNLENTEALLKTERLLETMYSVPPTVQVPTVPALPLTGITGLDALNATITAGIAIKPFWSKTKDKDASSYSLAVPDKSGERYKAYISGRYVVLDVDRWHDPETRNVDHELHSEADGIYTFHRWTKEDEIRLPPYLQNPEIHPCYVATPSGGYHFYFKYTGKPLPSFLFCSAVEVKTTTITAAGSFKDGKPYTLYGSFSDVPLLPYFILKAYQKELEAYQKKKAVTTGGKSKYTGKSSWENIKKFTKLDGKGSAGRNALAFSLAVHAYTHNWTAKETLDRLLVEPDINTLPEREIITAVKSAFGGF